MTEEGSPRPSEASAFYFGPVERRLAGWWHRPVDVRGDLGVVFCASYGREEAGCHRTLLHLARAAASAGLHGLRFDYEGCGDSAGDASIGRPFEAWLDSVDAAIDQLRSLSGCRRVAVVGLRLGALLGSLVAARRGDVDAFIALAPVVNGRSFVRELRALSSVAKEPDGAAMADGSVDSGGFFTPSAAVDALAAVDLLQLADAPAPRMMIVERDDFPSTPLWPRHLGSLGVEITLQRAGGFAEMLQDPHHSVVPQPLVDLAARWLAAEAAAEAPPAPPSRMPASTTLVREADVGGVHEQLISISVDGIDLFGVAALPSRQPASGLGLLLLNAGAQRHTGPGRLYVEIARRCARLGAVVVRIDLSGLGESPPRPGAAENVVYPASAVREVLGVLHQLRRRYAFERCHVAGLCSGAYHAMKSHAHGAPVDGVLAINPLTYFWHPGTPLDAPLSPHKVTAEIARYRSVFFAADRWRKLLRGDVDLAVAGTLLRHGVRARISSGMREVARLLRRPVDDDLAPELQRYATSGTALRLLFADDEPGESLLRSQAGRAVDRLLRDRTITIERVRGGDHTFTGRGGRSELMTLLERWLLSASTFEAPNRAQIRARPVLGPASGSRTES